MESERERLIQSIQERTKRMSALTLPDITGFDLTMTQLKVVMLLHVKQQMHVRDIAQLFCVTSATISGIVDRLVERGLMVRETDPEDRRAVICRLSDSGMKLTHDFWNIQRQWLDAFLTELSLKHLRAYDDLLDVITKNIMRNKQTPDDASQA